MKHLFNTSVPVPFECFYAAKVEKDKNVERRLHRAFSCFRVNKNREFFEIEPEAVADILGMVAIEDVTPRTTPTESPEDVEAIRKLERRADRFSFQMVGISPGPELTFDKEETITCVVRNNREVEFMGRNLSLSGAALEALHQVGYEWKSAQGAAHWCYQGRRLKDIREELENQ